MPRKWTCGSGRPVDGCLRVALLFLRVFSVAFPVAGLLGQSQPQPVIHPSDSFEVALSSGQAHTYSLALESGDAALIVVRQIGVDVVVEVNNPKGEMMDSIDSPTGRYGDEIVELEATESGRYSIRVRPIDSNEPSGRYHLHFVSLLNSRQTAEMIQNATHWLAQNSVEIPDSGDIGESLSLRPLDLWLGETRVLGIGEATHGSREFGDLRLSLTERLIRRNGFRIVAVEGSESRFQTLAPYIRGDVPENTEITKRIETGWMGRRSQRNLIQWVRSWNLKHPQDQVRIIGIDAQDNQDSRETLGHFIEKAYGEDVLKRWKESAAELSAANEQIFVFGDSGVNSATRQLLLELNAMLEIDAPVQQARFGADFVAAKEAAKTLLEFADFNSNGDGAISHSRDWYMANRVLRGLQESGPASKAVYWAHNAHVVHPKGSTRTAGGVLRDVLGCRYAALAVTFGQGAFVAQIPNDLEDRLAVSILPPAPKVSVEALLSQLRPGGSLIAWNCRLEQSETPDWFHIPHRMHWVGGLYTPGKNSMEAFAPFALLSDFDGIVYLPSVTADEVPTDRPQVPARTRR
jgi:erythromycin esterase